MSSDKPTNKNTVKTLRPYRVTLYDRKRNTPDLTGKYVSRSTIFPNDIDQSRGTLRPSLWIFQRLYTCVLVYVGYFSFFCLFVSLIKFSVYIKEYIRVLLYLFLHNPQPKILRGYFLIKVLSVFNSFYEDHNKKWKSLTFLLHTKKVGVL